MTTYKIRDELLIQALKTYNERWTSQMPEDEDLIRHEFSQKFVWKMDKLIRAQKRSTYYLMNTMSKRIAVAVLLIFLTLFTTVFSVKALRDPAINFIINVYEKFSTIIFGGSSEETESFPPFLEEYYEPSVLPDGFTRTKTEDLMMLYVLEYKDGMDGILNYQQYTIKSGRITINTEGVEVEYVTINGFTGIYYSNLGYQTIVWNDGRYGYLISANLPREAIFEVAGSLVERAD
ncbi:MAG: DUF4367 domain-containing protein [Saccharofermentanales bacterium]